MRVIVRKEVPHVGAQLRITDVDGMRYTALATNQDHGQLADLEVRHRLRARCEDRIRNAKGACQVFCVSELSHMGFMVGVRCGRGR